MSANSLRLGEVVASRVCPLAPLISSLFGSGALEGQLRSCADLDFAL